MKKCRICGASLDKASHLACIKNAPLTDSFRNKATPTGFELIQDIDIYICDGCSIVQNPSTVDLSGYYSDYAYSTEASMFSSRFMKEFAKTAVDFYYRTSGTKPRRAIEPGSGDGQLLLALQELDLNVVGIEPSDPLVTHSRSAGLEVVKGFFDSSLLKHYADNTFDICISSYTLDHCPDPVDYFKTSNQLLQMGGLSVFEIHDLDLILSRSEYCLLEHEHTVYLDENDIARLANATGFEVVSINPMKPSQVRGNSLIGILKKVRCHNKDKTIVSAKPSSLAVKMRKRLERLAPDISDLILRLDEWAMSVDGKLSGYGAGGRGVMTLAQMESASKFNVVLDKSFDTREVLMPKTKVPVVGPSRWKDFTDNTILVFSFGYFAEIYDDLVNRGFDKSKIVSLADFLA